MSARSKKALVVAVLATPLFVGGAQGATWNWNNFRTDFNDPASWTDTLPTTTVLATFSGTAVKQPNLSANFTVGGLKFPAASSGYDITATSPFSLTLATAGVNIALNGLNISGVNTVNAPLVLGATTATATQGFSQAAGGTLVVNGAISNINSVTLSIAGAGTTTLAGANTYIGGTKLDAASTLNINNGGAGGMSSAIGTGGFTWIGGGTVNNTSSSKVTLSTNNNVTLSGTAYTFTGFEDLDFGLGAATTTTDVRFNNNSTKGKTLTFGSLVNKKSGNTFGLTVMGASDAAVVLGGFTLNKLGINRVTNTVSGTGSVKFTGVISDGTMEGNNLTYKGMVTGTLQMGGANTYTGITTINSGAIQLDGTTTGQGDFVVQPGSGATVAPKLTGTGTIGLASGKGVTMTGGPGAASVTYLAIVNPGDIDTDSATLRIGTDSTNKVTFGDSSMLVIDINGDATDTLAITGDLDLSSASDNLLINTSGSQTLGRYVFATYTGSLTGTFANVTYKGGSLADNLSIDYTNNEIALVGLPEPVGISFFMALAGVGCLRRRRARRA